MKTLKVDQIGDDELIMRFVSAAKRMGEAVLDCEPRDANRMYDYMRAIDLTLRSRGTVDDAAPISG